MGGGRDGWFCFICVPLKNGYITTDEEGLLNFGLCSALMVFEQ